MYKNKQYRKHIETLLTKKYEEGGLTAVIEMTELMEWPEEMYKRCGPCDTTTPHLAAPSWHYCGACGSVNYL